MAVVGGGAAYGLFRHFQFVAAVGILGHVATCNPYNTYHLGGPPMCKMARQPMPFGGPTQQ